MALTPAQEDRLEDIVREAKAVRRRATVLVQMAARLHEEASGPNEQTEEVISNERREPD